MLDKAVPYFDVLMQRPAGLPLPEPTLPEGFSFRFFQAGDEKHWARLEASVLEFDDAVEALLRFQRDFLPMLPELERRCIFVEDTRGKVVATAMAWWRYTGSRRDPWLYWVSADPAYQGRGLGRAVVVRCLQLMTEIEGKRDFYLHTQTWSHRAVGLYESLGFVITPEPGLGDYPNTDYRKALAVLEQVRRNS